MEEVASYAEGMGLDKGAYFLNISGGKTMHLLTTSTSLLSICLLLHIPAIYMPFAPHPCYRHAF